MGGCQLNFTVSLDIKNDILSFYRSITLAGWCQLCEFLCMLLFYLHKRRKLFKDLETWALGQGGGKSRSICVRVCVRAPT